jgi:hypothetical protein
LFAPINETQVIKNCISTVSFDVNGFQSVNENYFGAFLTVFTTNANYVDNNYENILILSPSNYGGSNTRKGSISSYCLKGGSYQKIVNFIGVKFVQEITNMPAFYDDSSNSGTKDYTNLTIANAKKQTSYTG